MRFLVFLLVGALNTLLGVAVYGLLLWIGLPFPAASGISLLAGLLVGFRAHARFVFRTKGMFLHYVVIWVGIYLMANGIIWCVRPFLGDFLAGLVAMPFNAGVGYLLMRWWVFGDDPSSSGGG